MSLASKTVITVNTATEYMIGEEENNFSSMRQTFFFLRYKIKHVKRHISLSLTLSLSEHRVPRKEEKIIKVGKHYPLGKHS